LFSDGPKRQGKFIKGKNRIAKTLRVTEFSFEAISNGQIAYPDNQSGNIYLNRAQDPGTMETVFKKPEKFEDEFGDHHAKNLKPLNFTEDWLREKSRSKRRGIGSFDEDDDDDDDNDSESQVKEASEFRQNRMDSMQASPFVMPDFSAEQQEPAPVVASRREVAAPQLEQVADLEDVRQKSGSIAGADIAHISSMKPTAQHLEDSEPTDIHLHDPSPVQRSNKSSAHHINQIELPVISPEERAEAFEEGKKIGYLDGYRQGEIKGNVKAQEDAQAMFGKLSGVLDEIEGLKRQIFENVQDIFIDVCEAVTEAIVRKEFKVNPHSFGEMIRQVVTESVPNDSFEIKLDPQMFALIEKAGMSDISARIRCDSSLTEPGDFRIESNLTAVDGNLRRMVKEMIDRAGIELFEDMRNVG
jgi:flagellar biosynthesis/type III secretory pathway protein FliH